MGRIQFKNNDTLSSFFYILCFFLYGCVCVFLIFSNILHLIAAGSSQPTVARFALELFTNGNRSE